ncbi:MAG: sugar transferase [Bacteroidota bacterium]
MYKSTIKPILDFLAALIGLLLLSPILLTVIVLVLIKLGYPVLYKQERPGINGKPFMMYKFRSMTNEADAQGNLLPNNKRLTIFGKKLRSTSLDELPSLLNVLKGEISIVGPRPLRMRYLPLFTDEQNKRHEVKPGITGYAQVNGRSNISWDEKFEMDVYYVKHLSFWLDIKIIFKTFWNVISKKDTNPEGLNFEIPFDDYIKQKHNA